MKILIRVVDDWGEIYVDGKFTYDGEKDSIGIIKNFLEKVSDITDIEIRFFEGHSTSQLTKDGKVKSVDIPLYIMNEKNYWSDWDSAEIVSKVEVEDDDGE